MPLLQVCAPDQLYAPPSCPYPRYTHTNHFFPSLPSFCSVPVAKDVFLENLWETFNTLQAKCDEEAGMPAYFRFLTLLGEQTRLHMWGMLWLLRCCE